MQNAHESPSRGRALRQMSCVCACCCWATDRSAVALTLFHQSGLKHHRKKTPPVHCEQEVPFSNLKVLSPSGTEKVS